MICRRCIVSGRVQGVWYRAATQEQARKLGLTGSAINRANGNVEVVVCGEEKIARQLCDWLWQGPTHAQVSDVKCENIDIAMPQKFTTG